MIMIGREKEGKEEVKKERTDLLPIYIFEKRGPSAMHSFNYALTHSFILIHR
jgi:hypothetical protein